jgi:hypothetical protein
VDGDAAHEVGAARGQAERDQSAVRAAAQVGGRGAELLDQRGQVVLVLAPRIGTGRALAATVTAAVVADRSCAAALPWKVVTSCA